MVAKSSRYHWVIRYAHWLTVLAIVLAYVLVDLVDDEGSEGNSPPSLMLQGHYLAGLAVLTLLLPRILARLTRYRRSCRRREPSSPSPHTACTWRCMRFCWCSQSSASCR
jgi:cytochrome b561